MKRALFAPPRRLAPISFALSSFKTGAALLLLASPLAAQNLQVRGAAGETSLQKNAAGWQVEQGNLKTALPVPRTVYFSALRANGQGYLAAGVDRGPQGFSLVVLRGEGKNVELLPAPQVAPGEWATAATLLTGPAGLEALLWIEGKNEQAGAVKAALWNGSAFGSPATIAPAGPGTQTALQAQRLADGSWLAVWSAFDGQDDEIVWSRGGAQGWSEPQAISKNNVPDITPALRQIGNGALLVWSFYDGNDYRLSSAVYRDAAWQKGESFGGKGSTNPSFADTQGTTLAFRQVEPESWRVIELTEEGKIKRQVGIPTATRRPPTILGVDDQAVTIEWSTTDATKTPVSIVVPWDEKN